MSSKKLHMSLLMVFLLGMPSSNGVQFKRMKFDQNVDVNAMETINKSMSSTNGTTIIGASQSSIEHIPGLFDSKGITFDIREDGELNINFTESDIYLGESTERIKLNGVSLKYAIRNEVYKALLPSITPQALTNVVLGMTWNPLWGKKLAVIGDSLISSPTKDTSYPAFIAKRNNMTLVHNGRGGERLCMDMTNSLGQITNPACINSYTNDIPQDADFILCQIGANDYVHWDQVDQTTIPDTDMTTNTFKGCWNLLLIGLKKNYPNARIGMILANNWTENLGQKTEDVIASNSRRERTQWQKIQCQKLNIPVFDPVEDTRNIQYHYVAFPTNTAPTIDELPLGWYERTKREIGTDNSSIVLQNYTFQCPFIVDTQHTTVKGNQYLSFYYERWMKTVLMCQ